MLHRGMSLFLTSLKEESEDHTVELLVGSFVIHRKPDREDQFDNLARRVLNTANGFAAFPRRDENGRYDCVHIIPNAA